MVQKYAIFALNLALTALVCINIYLGQYFVFSLVSGCLFLLINLCLLASILSKKNTKSWIFALIILLGMIIIPGSIIYYFYQLNTISLIFLTILISAIIILFWIKNNQPLIKPRIPKLKLTFLQFVVLACYFVLIFFIYKILYQSRADIAVPTPWALIDSRIFVLYFSATFILIAFLLKTKLKLFWSQIFLAIHFFTTFSVSWIVYKLGFGFDPFIHQKTVEIISEKGFILPKPLYYLGQYSLEVFLHKITLLPIDWIDKLLVPILAAITIPAFIIKSFSKLRAISIVAIFFLAIPFSFLVFSTPQNFSILFSILTVILSLRYLQTKNISWLWLLLLSIISLAIHPLTGLPILFFSLAIFIFKSKANNLIQKIGKILFLVFSAILVPLSFLIINAIKGYNIAFQFSWQQIGSNISSFIKNIFYFENNYRYIYDLIYFYEFNWKIFTIIFIAICLIIFRKRLGDLFGVKDNKIAKQITWIYIGAFIFTGINYLILKNFFVFEELIYYERADYALRLITLMFIFLLPLLLIFISKIVDSLRENKTGQFSILLLLSLLISASFYFSYPRYDNIDANHGLNVSQYDFRAAQLINNIGSDSYVVLATQNTSVAAVKLFGFEPVYNNQFYYPIPTGSELYEIFLKMVNDQPKIEYINETKELTGAESVYFVLPKYWNNCEQIKIQAEQIANETLNIDGQIFIYKFD